MKNLTLGVINITPNSFSDSNKFHDNLAKVFDEFASYKGCADFIWDFGAESTAPFNDPISSELECSRLEGLFNYLGSKDQKTVSLDSYQPETVFWFFKELKKLGFSDSQFIWNDVSGQWDEFVDQFLRDFKESRYIYSHNLAPERSLTSSHMDYLHEGDIFSHLHDYFRDIPTERVILDPCFGFSKTYEQNWALIEQWNRVLELLPQREWLIGLSKKSFLRQKLMERVGTLEKNEALVRSEWVHLDALRHILTLSQGLTESPYIFRVHDPVLISYLGANNP